MDNQSQTFDKVLCDLVNKNAISREEALKIAGSRINLSLMLSSGDDNHYDESDFSEDKGNARETQSKHRISMAEAQKNKRTARGKQNNTQANKLYLTFSAIIYNVPFSFT